MAVLDLRPRLAAIRRKRFLRRYGVMPFPPAGSSFYAANLRLALLPMMLAYVWMDETRRYAEAMLAALALSREPTRPRQL